MGTHYMSLSEIRQRLGLSVDYDAYWLVQQRDLYATSTHETFKLNEDSPFEAVLTIEGALAWGNRLADEWLR